MSHSRLRSVKRVHECQLLSRNGSWRKGQAGKEDKLYATSLLCWQACFLWSSVGLSQILLLILCWANIYCCVNFGIFLGNSRSLICIFHNPCNPALLEPWDAKYQQNPQLCLNLMVFSLNVKKWILTILIWYMWLYGSSIWGQPCKSQRFLDSTSFRF